MNCIGYPSPFDLLQFQACLIVLSPRPSHEAEFYRMDTHAFPRIFDFAVNPTDVSECNNQTTVATIPGGRDQCNIIRSA